jgi:hypothetical protein
MLQLWFRSLGWMVWWPLSTWLLMVQKAGGQVPAACRPPRPWDSDDEPVSSTGEADEE